MSYDLKFSAENTIVGLLIRMPKMKTKLLMTAIASVATLSATSASAQLESLREVVYYNFNSAQSAEVEAQMQKITDLASSRNASSIRVTCHTDTTGSAAYNQALSERRAADVLNALVSRGVSSNIISSSGLGETSPLVPTGDNVKEQLNRRCEIDMDVESVLVQQQPVQEVYREYVAPQQSFTPQTQTVTETVNSVPTPIEPTVVTRTVPSVGQPITSTVPTASIPQASVPSATIPSAPYVPPSTPSLPPVATSGGLGSSGLLLGAAGIAAGVGLGLIVDGGGVSDDEFAAAQAAQAAAEAQAAAAAQAQAAAEAAAADAATAGAADAAAAADALAAAQAAADAAAAQAAAEAALANAQNDFNTVNDALTQSQADLANAQDDFNTVNDALTALTNPASP